MLWWTLVVRQWSFDWGSTWHCKPKSQIFSIGTITSASCVTTEKVLLHLQLLIFLFLGVGVYMWRLVFILAGTVAWKPKARYVALSRCHIVVGQVDYRRHKPLQETKGYRHETKMQTFWWMKGIDLLWVQFCSAVLTEPGTVRTWSTLKQSGTQPHHYRSPKRTVNIELLEVRGVHLVLNLKLQAVT